MARHNKNARHDNSSGTWKLSYGPEIGAILSECSSTNIRTGIECEEKFIAYCERHTDLVPVHYTGTLRKILGEQPRGMMIVRKKQAMAHFQINGIERDGQDFLFFHLRDDDIVQCSPVQMKMGHDFDTTKSEGQIKSMWRAAKIIQGCRKNETVIPMFVAFAAESNADARAALKASSEGIECWSGAHFCEHLDVDYDAVCKLFANDAKENERALIEEVVSIARRSFPETIKGETT